MVPAAPSGSNLERDMKEITRIGEVTLFQSGPDDFTVQYGKQVRGGLNYCNAAHQLGECLFHQLACDSKLDNRLSSVDEGDNVTRYLESEGHWVPVDPNEAS